MKKKVLSMTIVMCMALSMTACGNKIENLEKEITKVIQEKVNVTGEEDTEPKDARTSSMEALEALEGMTFSSEEEMAAYFRENVDPTYGVFEPNYESRVKDIETEKFLKKSPLERFEIYVEEINNSKYRNGEKSELAERITNLYNETTDKETKEKMDSIVRRKLFKNGQLIELFPQFNDNEKLVLIAMENGGYMIQASERLQHDKDFLRKALDRHGNGVLGSIDKEILTDKEFCLYMFKKGYLEVYNRLVDEVGYSGNEKAKELIKDKEIITEIYESMKVMEFEDMKELDEYINDPQLLADRLFGLFSEDFRAKRLEYVLEFDEKNKDLEKIK